MQDVRRWCSQSTLLDWEIQGQATTAEPRFPNLTFNKATLANLVEQPQQPLGIRQSAVAVPIRASGLATVILE